MREKINKLNSFIQVKVSNKKSIEADSYLRKHPDKIANFHIKLDWLDLCVSLIDVEPIFVFAI